MLENLIEAPIAHQQVTRKEAIARAYELLDVVGLRNKADAWSRASLRRPAAAYRHCPGAGAEPAGDPVDEPTSALDPELVGRVLDVIKKLARSGTTLVVVTHEIGFAREVADQVVFMVDGRIVEQGSSDEVLNHPQHPRTRQFYPGCCRHEQSANDPCSQRFCHERLTRRWICAPMSSHCRSPATRRR
ncbi:Amino acid ABC transporter [Klebsiella pneumoniae]|uniref:Amino acid ABC transporter n=1 Tax=Klebsiella pneumoniae TaxID=573 RepID=A0A377ZYS9_KLEPN|nr:Amino acid ABC transporter [Klebsiella pneumoniae]